MREWRCWWLVAELLRCNFGRVDSERALTVGGPGSVSNSHVFDDGLWILHSATLEGNRVSGDIRRTPFRSSFAAFRENLALHTTF